MVIASLKIALNEAIRPDAEMYAAFMGQLQAELTEITDILKEAYAHIKVPVTLSCDSRIFGQIQLFYSFNNYPGEAYNALEESCRLNGTDIIEIDVFDEYYWDIELDFNQREFRFKYNSLSPEEVVSENGINYKQEKEEKYPATDIGYQQLVCRLADILNRFMPTEVKIAYFHESSHRQGQQMLNFVLE